MAAIASIYAISVNRLLLGDPRTKALARSAKSMSWGHFPKRRACSVVGEGFFQAKWIRQSLYQTR